MKGLELRLPPLLLVALFGAAILAGARQLPLASVPFPGHRWLALGLALLGAGVAALGVIEFRRARTTVDPTAPERATALVRSGIYRLTRNPMYLGFALLLLGAAAWGSSLTGYALVPPFVAYLTRFQILPEERALRQRFGDEYTAYMAAVRRWI
jgi:protein-S-isoprenylcysteine O-methyltransferase Ste14